MLTAPPARRTGRSGPAACSPTRTQQQVFHIFLYLQHIADSLVGRQIGLPAHQRARRLGDGKNGRPIMDEGQRVGISIKKNARHGLLLGLGKTAVNGSRYHTFRILSPALLPRVSRNRRRSGANEGDTGNNACPKYVFSYTQTWSINLSSIYNAKIS